MLSMKEPILILHELHNGRTLEISLDAETKREGISSILHPWLWFYKLLSFLLY